MARPKSTEGLHPATVAEGRERSALVRSLFSGIAPRYDLVNHVGSFGIDIHWRRRLVAELGMGPGHCVLDVCSGTGDLAMAVSARGASVLALDSCRPMLLEGIGKRFRGAVVQVEGDALDLPVASNSVDAACVAFGIRNVVDPARGIEEMTRCVRAGGKVAVLEFSRPPARVVRWVYEAYSGHVLPFIGDLLSGRRGTYRYLPQTVRGWLTPEELAAMMEAAGLVDVAFRRLSFGVTTLHVGTVAAGVDEIGSP